MSATDVPLGVRVYDDLEASLDLDGPPVEDLVTRRQRVELRKLTAEAERAELEVAALRRREADACAEATRHLEYTFYGRVDPETVRAALAELALWHRRDPGAPLTLVFNSPGGNVLDGLALFDYVRHLRQEGHHVTTIVLGRAASMGAVLLQAGDRRVVGENAFVMLHEISSGVEGSLTDLTEGVDFHQRLQKRLVAILAERSTLGTTAITRRWKGRDWWLDAQEAVGLGFADQVR